MPVTLRGIYHNLKESKYTISNSEVVFFFSSELYLRKFMSDYQCNRVEFNKRLNKVTNEIPLNMDMLADITLYEKTEKRGFRVWLKGVNIDWGELYKYSLRKMTEKDSLGWEVIEKPKLTERMTMMRDGG